MSAFEFFFSFYGLILGLSAVEAVSGVTRLLRGRAEVRIGLLTPLLVGFVLLDIASFWVWGWRDFGDMNEVRYGVLIYYLAVAVAYYMAASTVFPRDFSEWSDLDEYYDRHKKWVFGGLIFANVASSTLTLIREQGGGPDLIWNALYFAGMIAAIFVKNRRVNLGLLVLLVGQYFYWALMTFRL